MLNLPPHLDPADVLAFIEGEPLSGPARQQIQAAMAADAAFRRVVEGMQSDRVGLVGLSRVHAPADLLNRVEAELSQADLLALAGAESAAATTVPISRVAYEGPSVVGVIMASPWTRRLAAAAAIAMAAGLAYIGLKSAFNKFDSRTTIVKNETTAPVPIEVPELREPVDVAVNDAPPLPEAVDPSANEPVAMVVQPKAPNPLYGMELDRALALAGEGKLLIRLRSLTAEDAFKKLEQRSEQRSRSAFAEFVPQRAGVALASLLPPMDSAAPRAIPASPEPVRAIASANPLTTSNPDLPAGLSATLSAVRHRLANLYAARFDTRAGLSDLLHDLARGNDMAIDLMELPTRVEIPPSTGGSSILWWSLPSNWDPPLAAPIVIETP